MSLTGSCEYRLREAFEAAKGKVVYGALGWFLVKFWATAMAVTKKRKAADDKRVAPSKWTEAEVFKGKVFL